MMEAGTVTSSGGARTDSLGPDPIATAADVAAADPGVAASVRRTAELLRSARCPLLLAHVSPDGDAVGSALAVGLALRTLGVAAVVSFDDDPFVLPRSLVWLPGQHILVAPDAVPQPDVAVSFDVSSVERLGDLHAVAESAAHFIAVDHHSSYTGFGTSAVIDVHAPATAVLALQLVDALGVGLDADIATCLYTGLMTDTGSFRYAATTPETHRQAARLLAAGVRHDLVARRVYDDVPFAALRMLGSALDRAQLDTAAAGGLGLVSTTVPRAERLALGLALDDAERIIDGLRAAVEAEVAVVLKQEDEGSWRVSLRSKGRIDVGAVATVLGGGGHLYAAGFTDGSDPVAVLAMVRAALAGAAILAD